MAVTTTPGPRPGISPGWSTAANLADLGALAARWLTGAAAALLAQIPARCAELARTETAIATAARRAGLPGEQIEASLAPGGAGR